MHIGLIIPSSNTVMEEEFSHYVTVHSTRVPLTSVDERSLRKMNEALHEALNLILDCSPQVIVYGCTSGSFVEDVEKFFKKSPIPVVTTSQAVVSALHVLGSETVSVATPYTDEINQREKKFLESQGFTVKDVKGLHLLTNTDIGTQRDETVHNLAVSLKRADVLFISCTNLRSFNLINRLEDEIGTPVISSNSASLWNALRCAHQKCNSRLGRLLEEFL